MSEVKHIDPQTSTVAELLMAMLESCVASSCRFESTEVPLAGPSGQQIRVRLLLEVLDTEQ